MVSAWRPFHVSCSGADTTPRAAPVITNDGAGFHSDAVHEEAIEIDRRDRVPRQEAVAENRSPSP